MLGTEVRLSVPPSDYGYWISPNGEYHPVSKMLHNEVAHKILTVIGDTPDEDGGHKLKLLRKHGYTRVVGHADSADLEIQTRQAGMSVHQRDALAPLVDHHRRAGHSVTLEREHGFAAATRRDFDAITPRNSAAEVGKMLDKWTEPQ